MTKAEIVTNALVMKADARAEKLSPNEKRQTPFTAEEQLRYSRQFLLPEVGRAGQERLKRAKVLCVGAGGLGSPAAIYLAAAGVGTIGIADFDRVDLSNLHRQILHGTADVGRPKTESARQQIAALNPHVEVRAHTRRLDRDNATEVLRDYDLVVDGSDNFPTRYLMNDVAFFAGKPNVYGSIFRFDGQATVFAPHLGGPCYRCLFPEPPPREAVPNCAEAGVLGVLPGIIGTIQAAEALKLILDLGESLLGRLLHVDALTMKFREFHLQRDPHCPVCGDHPSIVAPMDYENFCAGTTTLPNDGEITVQFLEEKMARGKNWTLLDVREPFEHEVARIEGARLISLGELATRLGELNRTHEIFVFCHSGVRSEQAAEFLRANGFPAVFNVAGGIDAWSREIDPEVPRY